MSAPIPLRSARFRQEREASWRALEALVDRVEREGHAALDGEDLRALATLYRAALSGLSVARATSLDQNLVDWLEGLCARAWLCVHGGQPKARQALGHYLRVWLPQTVRAMAGPIALSAAFLLAGGLVAFALTLSDLSLFDSFVPPGRAHGRDPTATTEALRAVLYDDGGGALDRLVAFASFLFTHNARIGLMACALGVGFGVPTAWLMFYNGLGVGALAALYHSRGLSLELWAWLLPHGVAELSAVILCGGAGFAIGGALLFPGRARRLDRLARAGRDAAGVALGAVGLLALAGLIEGVFRQTVHSVSIRYAVAATTALLGLLWLGRGGRRS